MQGEDAKKSEKDYALFFCKNIFSKNIEAKICEILRTF